MTPDKPFLSDQEALDIAAFVNCDSLHPRSVSVGTIDYPDPKTKPVDYGVGPYVDSFLQAQHKYGPYKPIIENLKKKEYKVSY